MRKDEFEIFVPGRICLFGEHSDWAGGYRKINSDIAPGSAIVVGTEQGITAKVKKSDKLEITSILPDTKKIQSYICDMEIKTLKRAAADGGYFSYIAGVAAYMLENYSIGGINIECIETNLPIKKGLSSSAAICVLTARAFNKLYNLRLTVRGEMESAYRGEILTPSRCGRMDQACAFGRHPVHMIFDGDNIDIKRIEVKNDIFMVLSDLNGRKDTKKILADLNRSYPFPKSEEDFKLHSTLGVENYQSTNNAIKTIRDGDIAQLGRLMTEVQHIFDEKVAPLSYEELRAEKLHNLLNDDYVRELTWGGKGVGSQGDGSVQFIAKGREQQEQLIEYLKNRYNLNSFCLTIHGERTVRKAVIPVAGYGTRLFPATKVVNKEFFPILDKDGLLKPALLVLLEELDSSGIEEICLIIKEGQEALYRNLFEYDMSEEHYNKLPGKMRDYDVKIKGLAGKIKFVEQKEQLGFGHAVYQSRDFTCNEPVLLVLGDHLFRSASDISCTTQLIDAFKLFGKTTVSIEEVQISKVSHYGIVSGRWEDVDEKYLDVSRIYEKPTCDYAEENLAVDMKNGDKKYFSVFGQYILTQSVYEVLGKNIDGNKLENGEYQLTSALDKIRKNEGMIAVVPEGERFDIGLPEAYRDTLYKYCTL